MERARREREVSEEPGGGAGKGGGLMGPDGEEATATPKVPPREVSAESAR